MQDFSKKLTIGQFARFNNISEQTLRYYDQIGLLHPDESNDKTGYRYYKITQCATLDIITHMKSLGIPRKESKTYLETKDTAWLISTLCSKYEINATHIALLQETQAIIKKRISDCGSSAKLPRAGIPYIEVLPARTIYKYDTKVNYYYNEDSASNYEYMLRSFKDNLLKQNVPAIYFYNVSSIMSQKNLINRNFITTELFVFINEDDQERFNTSETVKADTFLCMICDDNSHEILFINRLLDEIHRQGYRITGDYICEVVSEFLSPKDDKRDMILKLQIPIAFD